MVAIYGHRTFWVNFHSDPILFEGLGTRLDPMKYLYLFGVKISFAEDFLIELVR